MVMIKIISDSVGMSGDDSAWITSWAATSSDDFHYLAGGFPRGMITQFILFSRDVDVARGGRNLILHQFGEERLGSMVDEELASLFLLVKKGFPIVSREQPIKEK